MFHPDLNCTQLVERLFPLFLAGQYCRENTPGYHNICSLFGEVVALVHLVTA